MRVPERLWRHIYHRTTTLTLMNSVTPGNLKPWLLPILSGILIGTSYIPFPPWASLFISVSVVVR